MTAAELVRAVEQRGGTVEVTGDSLVIRPKRILTDELLTALKERKSEVIRYLQERRPRWRDCTPEEAREDAAAYTERGWIAIYSEVLREPIILARDEEAAKAAPAGFVTYTEAEVALLLTATPDELRQVHEAKKFCGGRVVERRQTEEEEKPA